MAQENDVNVDDVLAGFKRFIKRIFRLIFSFFRLIYSKRFIFLILIVIGVIAGFFLDVNKPVKYGTTLQIRTFQESTEYVYDLINHLNEDLADTVYMDENGFIDQEIAFVEIKPIANMEDLLTTFKDDNSQTLETLILNTSTQDLLTSEFFRSQYQHHEVTIRFGKDYKEGTIDRFLDFLNNNAYYQKLHRLRQESLSAQIAEGEKSIQQIDTLIANYQSSMAASNAPSSFTALISEKKTSSIYDLLNFKNELVGDIQDFKKEKEQLEKPVVLTNKPVVLKNKSVFRKDVFFLPLVLSIGFLIVLLFVALGRKVKSWTERS